jgi:universal stress protein A
MTLSDYQHILIAVDLSPEARQVLARGKDLAERYGARLSLIHVVEPVLVDNSYDLMTSLPAELDTTMLDRATEFLEELAGEFSLSEVTKEVALGSVKAEIFRFSEERQVDLIVLGTHGRHGVGLLLGSTANAILHGTPCDVHAVRIHGQA